MARHRNKYFYQHFDVNRHLHELTHWEKSCSYLGYCDCSTYSQFANTLLLFAVLLSFDGRHKQSFTYRQKNLCNLIIYYERVRSDNDSMNKCFRLISAYRLLIRSVMHYRRGRKYGNQCLKTTSIEFKVTPILHQNIIYNILFSIHESTSKCSKSICRNGTILLILMLLMLCGDVEVNPGPVDIGNKKLSPRLLHSLKWFDDNGRKKKLKIYELLSGDWEKVADYLRFDHKVNGLRNSGEKPEKNIREVFEEWSRNRSNSTEFPYTWNGLCKLLYEMDYSSASADLQSALESKNSTILSYYKELIYPEFSSTSSATNSTTSSISSKKKLPSPVVEKDVEISNEELECSRALTDSLSKPYPGRNLTFSELCMEKMTTKQKQKLIEDLESDSLEMIHAFSKIMLGFRNFLSRSDAKTFMDVKYNLLILMDLPTVRNHPNLTIRDDLDSAQNEYEILQIINNYCSFFSYNLLKSLFENLNYEEGNEHIKAYEKELADYAKRRIYYIPCSGIVGEERLELQVILDERFADCNGSILQGFCKDLSTILNIPKHHLTYYMLRPGSICVIFHLPAHLKYKYFPLSLTTIRKLQEQNMTEYNNAKFLKISCENFQYDLQSDITIKTPDGCIILVGKPGSGKTTAVNNIFDLDTLKRTSPSIITEFIVQEDITRHDKVLRIIDTPGLRSIKFNHGDMKSEVRKAINDAPYCVLYCLPITESYLTHEDPDILDEIDKILIHNLQEALGPQLWKKCVLLVTFSDTIEPTHNKLELFRNICQSFQRYLQRMSSGIKVVKSILEYKEKERISENTEELVTIPISRTKDIQTYVAQEVLIDRYNWTDMVFTEIARKVTEEQRLPLVCVKYDVPSSEVERDLNLINSFTAGAGSTIGISVGAVGAGVGAGIATIFIPGGFIVPLIGAVIGGALGLTAGGLISIKMSSLYAYIAHLLRSRA